MNNACFCLMIAFSQKKSLVDGWMNGREGAKAVLRIAYNQKVYNYDYPIVLHLEESSNIVIIKHDFENC